jgi:hypothetical protein
MTEDKPISARELWATRCSAIYVADPSKIVNPGGPSFKGVVPKEAVSYTPRRIEEYQSKPLIDLTTLAIFNALVL